jgi:histidine ammonia-lyase
VQALCAQEGITFVEEDRPLYADMELMTALLRAGRISALLRDLPEVG